MYTLLFALLALTHQSAADFECSSPNHFSRLSGAWSPHSGEEGSYRLFRLHINSTTISKRTLLCVHGHQASYNDFREIGAYYAERGWRVLSASFDEEPTALAPGILDEQVKFIGAAIATECTNGCDLLGHSMGGLVVMEAAKNSEKLDLSITILSSPISAHPVPIDLSWERRREISDYTLSEFTGGLADLQVPYETTGTNSRSLESMTGVHVSTSHIGLLFCNQFIERGNLFLDTARPDSTCAFDFNPRLVSSEPLPSFASLRTDSGCSGNGPIILNNCLEEIEIRTTADQQPWIESETGNFSAAFGGADFWFPDQEAPYRILRMNISGSSLILPFAGMEARPWSGKFRVIQRSAIAPVVQLVTSTDSVVATCDGKLGRGELKVGPETLEVWTLGDSSANFQVHTMKAQSAIYFAIRYWTLALSYAVGFVLAGSVKLAIPLALTSLLISRSPQHVLAILLSPALLLALFLLKKLPGMLIFLVGWIASTRPAKTIRRWLSRSAGNASPPLLDSPVHRKLTWKLPLVFFPALFFSVAYPGIGLIAVAVYAGFFEKKTDLLYESTLSFTGDAVPRPWRFSTTDKAYYALALAAILKVMPTIATLMSLWFVMTRQTEGRRRALVPGGLVGWADGALTGVLPVIYVLARILWARGRTFSLPTVIARLEHEEEKSWLSRSVVSMMNRDLPGLALAFASMVLVALNIHAAYQMILIQTWLLYRLVKTVLVIALPPSAVERMKSE